MICPILSYIKQVDGSEGYSNCVRKKCAWWVSKDLTIFFGSEAKFNGCAIIYIADGGYR